jgi:hypothetical protein
MDVAHEIVMHGRSQHMVTWVEPMRRLNGIEDPLARRILALHRYCNNGIGNCDACEPENGVTAGLIMWPCETTEAIARHFGIQHPGRPDGADPKLS